MKKQLFGYLLFSFLLIHFSVFAQHKDYPIKKVNGTDYYQYTVQVSEGLFAIGRKFNVSPEDISKANPEIKNGLKVGQRLLIPVSKTEAKTEIAETQTQTEFVEHSVEKKQTLFAISRKYNVSQEDIKIYNPELEGGLREGMILRIPQYVKESKKKDVEKTVFKEEKSVNKTVSAKKNTTIHVVQQDETLYSLAKRYKVEVADIIALNPESATKLAVGTELKIPTKDGSSSVIKKDSTTIKTAKEEYDINKLLDAGLYSKQSNKQSNVIRIAFLLPFMLDQDKKDASVERFVEFYAGSLLAVEAAKEKGISFEIHAFDTEKSEEKLTEVLQNSEIKTMDLIIGPAFSNQVSLISDFAKENKINTLIPFSSKVADIDTNPYLFQFNPGSDTQLSFAVELFTGKYKNAHLVFAELPGISSQDEGKIWWDDLKKELRKNGKSYSGINLTTSDMADFSGVLKAGEKNLIIFNTDKYAYVSPFIAALRTASTENEIVLFEQYSWRNQSEKLPKGMYFSPFIVNPNTEKLSDYNRSFVNYFGKSNSKESPRYDLLGYDLTGYFASLIQRYGNKFTEKAATYNYSDGIQSRPRFERISNGSGFINQRIYLIED